MPEQSPRKERRRHPRLELSWPVRYSWYTFSGDNIMSPHDYFGVAKNLGPKGICFVTEDPPPTGAFLELKITIPERGFDFEALACVIWTSNTESGKYEVGAEIFAMDEEVKQEISKILATQVQDKI